MSDVISVRESAVRARANAKPDPEAYIKAFEACVHVKANDSKGATHWLVDRDSDCYRALWKRERGTDYHASPKATRRTQTHAKTTGEVLFGVGDALGWAFGVMGYQVKTGCSCKSTQRWANERRWHEWTRASVRAELLRRLSDEARRRKILPRCRCRAGACSRDSWGRLIRAGIRDRARAAWRAIQQAGRGHAHGAGHHRGPDPRA